MVRAHAPSCSKLTENEHPLDLEDFFGEMPGMLHVPIAEASSVTVQGRLKEHSDFWLTELEALGVLYSMAIASPFYHTLPQFFDLITSQHCKMSNLSHQGLVI